MVDCHLHWGTMSVATRHSFPSIPPNRIVQALRRVHVTTVSCVPASHQPTWVPCQDLETQATLHAKPTDQPTRRRAGDGIKHSLGEPRRHHSPTETRRPGTRGPQMSTCPISLVTQIYIVHAYAYVTPQAHESYTYCTSHAAVVLFPLLESRLPGVPTRVPAS